MQNYYMNFSTQVITKSDGKHYYVEGYASTIDKDLAEDIVSKSAQMDILDSIKNRTITLDLDHERFINKDGTIADRPHAGSISVGKIVHAELRSKGVWVRAEINPHSDRFKSVWNSIKNKFLNAFSVAFRPVEIITKKTEEGMVRVIKRLNLYNIALTGEAANPNATFKPVMKSLLNNYKKEANNMSEENKTETKDKIDLKSVNKRLDSIEESVKTVIKNKELEDKINDLGTRVDKLEQEKEPEKPKEEEPEKEPEKPKEPEESEETDDKEEKKENTVKSNSKLKLKSTVEQPKQVKKEKKETSTGNVLDLF